MSLSKKIVSIIVAIALLSTITACKKQKSKGNESDLSDLQNGSVVNSSESMETNSNSDVLSGDNSSNSQDINSSANVNSSSTTSSNGNTPSQTIPANQNGTGSSGSEAGAGTINESKVSFIKESASADVKLQNLSNSYYKLSHDKSLRVGYLGGSITVGTGAKDINNCWRARMTKWFQETYVGATITEINGGQAGTGSGYATTRAYRDMLSKNPDLIFVEFVCNDIYQKYTAEESGYYLELLLNEIYSKNKYVDVVLVLVTDKSYYGAENEFTVMYKNIAKHYGITAVDVGAALKQTVEKSGKGWDYYLADWVHPLDEGHRVYFETVRDAIKPQFVSGGNTAKVLPAGKYMKYISSSVETIYPESMNLTENSGFTKKKNLHNSLWGKSVPVMISSTAGNSMTFSFSGVGLLIDFYQSTSMCSAAKIIVDNKYEYNFSTRIDGPERQTKTAFQGLPNGNHTLKIINVSGGMLEIASVTQLK